MSIWRDEWWPVYEFGENEHGGLSGNFDSEEIRRINNAFKEFSEVQDLIIERINQ